MNRLNFCQGCASAAAFALVTLASAAHAADGTKVTEKQYDLPKCQSPVASVMVGKLACKSAGCASAPAGAAQSQNPLVQLALAQAAGQQGPNLSAVGEGMAAMLTTVLKETGCFDIQDREAMEELAKELSLAGKKLETQQADFMISGAITSISMTTERKQLGGGFIPLIGAISTTTKAAEIGLDIKVVDVNKARIVEAKTFQANNETTSTSFGAAGWGGAALLGGAMQSIKGTPMEPIIRDVLAQVAAFTANRMVATRNTALVANAPAPAPAASAP